MITDSPYSHFVSWLGKLTALAVFGAVIAPAAQSADAWRSTTEPPKEWMDQALKLKAGAKSGAAMDEPMGGKTLQGTPVTPRVPECFPAESRDLFWEMDMVPGLPDAANGTTRPLQPLNFDIDGDGKLSNLERDAIRGRNTWVMWCGGNEGFWDWLTQNGYGITDFLILIDSRKRQERFETAGLINQPGFDQNLQKNSLGLYLDKPSKTLK